MDTAVQILLYTCGLRIATADYDVFNNLSFFIITVQKARSTKKWFLKGSNVSTSVYLCWKNIIIMFQPLSIRLNSVNVFTKNVKDQAGNNRTEFESKNSHFWPQLSIFAHKTPLLYHRHKVTLCYDSLILRKAIQSVFWWMIRIQIVVRKNLTLKHLKALFSHESKLTKKLELISNKSERKTKNCISLN